MAARGRRGGDRGEEEKEEEEEGRETKWMDVAMQGKMLS